jgi:hypothetical protein
MKFLKEFGDFWYDFIIGDDWKVAVAVVLALGATVLLLLTGVFSDHLLAVLGSALVVSFFAVSLVVDVRRSD